MNKMDRDFFISFIAGIVTTEVLLKLLTWHSLLIDLLLTLL